MMGVYVMVVAIVLIAMVGRVMTERYKALGRAAGDSTPHLRTADAAAAQEELRRLKERVAVLERVVTENHGSLDLERQIERLRDH